LNYAQSNGPTQQETRVRRRSRECVLRSSEDEHPEPARRANIVSEGKKFGISSIAAAAATGATFIAFATQLGFVRSDELKALELKLERTRTVIAMMYQGDDAGPPTPVSILFGDEK